MNGINIGFRFDDPSWVSDHAVEQHGLEMFEKYNFPVIASMALFVDSDHISHIGPSSNSEQVGCCWIITHGGLNSAKIR